MRTPNGARNAWPGLFDTKNPFNIISMQFLTRGGIDNCWFNTEEREGSTARFSWCSEGKRGNDM